MHSVRAHPQHAPSGVGTLMDPEFLRQAWHDGEPGRYPAPQGASGRALASPASSALERCARTWHAAFGRRSADAAPLVELGVSAIARTRSDR